MPEQTNTTPSPIIEIIDSNDSLLGTIDSESDAANTPSEPLFRESNLTDVRKRLLDLTARSPLLNYKFPTSSSIRLVDASIDNLYEKVSSGGAMDLLAVPEPKEGELIEAGYIEIDPQTNERVRDEKPSSEDWARHLKIPTSYEFSTDASAENQKSKSAQTLLFAELLDARLKTIARSAATSMEERGANTLFLAIGFLEWYESARSDRVRRAPLIVLPVRLDRAAASRAGGRRAYYFTGTGEDLLSNLTLTERLRNDYDLELPEYGEAIGVEKWFAEVERVVQQHDPRWRIARSAAVGLWDFAKQAMYLDLDPARWGDKASLTSHSIIKSLFSDAEQDSGKSVGSSYGTEHLIDNLDSVHDRYPLISDADSSQHSAIVDAVNGQNIVIEGPPGTGKSQTITNLIAACVSGGKSVLFVAEKMDALDVVARRLKEAGLGDLCLELHSYKASKLEVLNSLVTAAENRKIILPPPDFENQIHRYESLRKQLGAVAKEMNEEWNSSGLTPHQILHKARELADQQSLLAVDIPNIELGTLTKNKIADLLAKAELLKHAAKQVAAQSEDGQLESHLWFGLGKADFQADEKQSIFNYLNDWNSALSDIAVQLDSMSSELGASASTELSENGAARLARDLTLLPAEVTESLFQHIKDFAANEQGLNNLLSGYRELTKSLDDLACLIHPEVLLNPAVADELRLSTDQLLDELGATSDNSSHDIKKWLVSASSLKKDAVELREEISEMASQLSEPLGKVIETRENGWRALRLTLNTVHRLPPYLRSQRNTILDNAFAQERVAEISKRLQSIDGLAGPLETLFNLDLTPDLSQLQAWQQDINNAGLFGFMKPAIRRTRAALRGCSLSKSIRRKDLEAALPNLREYQKQIVAMHNLEQENPVLDSLYKGRDTPIKQLELLVGWYKHISDCYGRGNSGKAKLGKAIRDLDNNSLTIFQNSINDGLAERLGLAQQRFTTIKLAFPKFAQSLPPHAAFCPNVSSDDSESKEEGEYGVLPSLEAALAKALEGIDHAMADPAASLSEVRNTAITWRDTLENLEKWRESKSASQFVPTLFKLPLPGDVAEKSAGEKDLETAIFLASIANSSPLLARAYQGPDPRLVHSRLIARRDTLSEACSVSNAARDVILKIGQINEEHSFIRPDNGIQLTIAQNTRRLEHPDWLDAWQSWERVKDKYASEHLGHITTAIQNGNLELDDVNTAIESSLYRKLAAYMLENNPSIKNLEGLEQNGLREQFRQTDRRLIELQREQVAYKGSQAPVPEGNAQGRVGSYSGMALIRHEHGKKKRHIAIRSMLNRATDAVKALKPCFMMSPMSVAQYLEPGNFEFDLIIMDEASQIRPEEALGAIARAKQLVVVGDPKQLPPTNFFSKTAADSEDADEDVGLQQSESILDAVLPLFDKRRLRWHYRSRHESLIDFSNKSFYESNLIVFPSPSGASDELGVKPEWVDGLFENQLNSIEAERIVNLVVDQLTTRPEETVGVVTMNAKQAEHIELKLEALAQANPELATAMEHSSANGEKLFVKNLERVQGDERDVIIISMTYGPATQGGRTAQRFGPINSATGWRRLNVLLTRARKRMHIITSMRSTDVITSATSSLGVRALRSLLNYCECGTIAGTVSHTGREPDSDFERSVMRRLEEHGYSCVPQLGVAGYFLDIAVLDPDDPGKFLLAIECDGATYHSAKSARDRDRLRQDVLESLGWKVHRIWSTDWFRAPDAQVSMVLSALDSAKSQSILINSESR